MKTKFFLFFLMLVAATQMKAQAEITQLYTGNSCNANITANETTICSGDSSINLSVNLSGTSGSSSNCFSPKVVGLSNTNFGMNATCSDNNGNLFVAGAYTGNTNFGNITLAGIGGKDVFLVKYNSCGIQQWALRGGSTGNEDYAGVGTKSIATDASGNIFIVGRYNQTFTFYGNNNTSFVAPYTSTSNGNHQDGYLIKLNASGEVLWGATLRGGSNDGFNGVAVDNSGNPIVTGGFNGCCPSTFAVTIYGPNGSLGVSSFGSNYGSGLVVKFDANGNILWKAAVYNRDTGLSRLAIDGTNNIYLVSEFRSWSNGTAAQFIDSNGTNNNLYNPGIGLGFLVKLNSSGIWQWGTSYGNVGDGLGSLTNGTDVAIDENGNPWISGFYRGATATFYSTSGSTLSLPASTNDIGFIAKYSSSGVPQFVNSLQQSTGSTYFSSIAISNGTVGIAGYFTGNNLGSNDMLFAKYDTNAVFQSVNTGGGYGDDQANSVVSNSTGFVVSGTIGGASSIDGVSLNTAGTFLWNNYIFGVSSNSFLWSTGETTSIINPSPTETTTYWCDVTTNGAACRKQITISVNDAQITASRNIIFQGENVILSVGSSSGLSEITDWNRVVDGDCYRLIVGSNGKLFVPRRTDLLKSDNNGLNWSNANWPLGIVRSGTSLFPGALYNSITNQYIQCTIDNGYWVSNDNGNSFTQTGPTGFGCGGVEMLQLNDGKILASMGGYQRGVYKSNSISNLTWSNKYSGVDSYDFVSFNDKDIFSATSNNLLKSTDQGESWTSIFNGNFTAVEKIQDYLLWISSSGSLFVENKDRVSTNTIERYNFGSGWFDMKYDNSTDILVVSKNASGIYISYDHGYTWEFSTINGVTSYNNICIYSGKIYIGTNIGLFYKKISSESYNWSTGETTATINPTPTETTTYWCDVTTNGATCRKDITITVNTTPAPTAEAQILCTASTVANLVATGTDLKWYAAESGGTGLATDAALTSGTYYVSQTLNNLESDRTAVAVSVNYAQITASASTVSSGTSVNLTVNGVNSLLNVSPTWELLISSSNYNGNNLVFSDTGYNQNQNLVYSLNGANSTIFNFNSNTVNTTALTNIGAAGAFTYDNTNNRLVYGRSGRDNIFAVPANGGNVLQIGSGSFDSESYGGKYFWNPVNQKTGYFGGYGFFAMKNWIWENNGNWTNPYANNTTCNATNPAKRIGQLALGAPNSNKLFLFSGQGSCDGNQFSSSCALGSPWATDVGVYCWLKDLWQLDLESYTFTNILPVNNSSITREGNFVYDYLSNTFYIIGGYVPSATYNSNYGNIVDYETNILRYRVGIDTGFAPFNVEGTPPPTVKLNSLGANATYFDATNNQLIWLRKDGVWGIKLTNAPQSSYLWSTGETTATINPSPTETTTYWCDVTTNGETCRKQITITVESLGIEDNTIDLKIKVYPNPTSQLLYVSHPEQKNFSIRITDLSGKQMYSGTITTAIPLDIAKYPQGMYLVTVTSKETNQKNSYKILKK